MAMWKNRCGRGATNQKEPEKAEICRQPHGAAPRKDTLAPPFGSVPGGRFDECEEQVLLLPHAVTLKCPWTIAAHSTFAIEDGISEGDIKAIRDGKLPENRKYRALSQFTKTLMETKGNATEADIEKFTSAGYSKAQVLEVVLCIGISTTTAATTNVAATPIEDRFKAQIWAAT